MAGTVSSASQSHPGGNAQTPSHQLSDQQVLTSCDIVLYSGLEQL